MSRITLFILIISFMKISSCSNNRGNKIEILKETELNVYVNEFEETRSVGYLNDKYFLNASCDLLSKPPVWLINSLYVF